MDIQSRVVNFYKNNQFVQNYLKGIDSKTNEVVLGYNGEEKRVSIDLLESFKTEEELMNYFQGKTVVTQNIVDSLPQIGIPQSDVSINNVEITPVAQEQTMLTSNNNLEPVKESLNDIKILTELKNKDGLDNILKKYAVNPSTGLIDINQAISKVTRNTMDEVEKSIKNNYEFSLDYSLYDIEGKYQGEPIIGTTSRDEKIMSSFNNIKLLLEASKMYPDQANYNDEQVNNFMRTYISKVNEELNGSSSAVGVNELKPDVPAANPVPQVNNEVINNQPNASAGFADIFVLTVIVLVYAVIIVNLILKLK